MFGGMILGNFVHLQVKVTVLGDRIRLHTLGDTELCSQA